jgi:hypothetical protein
MGDYETIYARLLGAVGKLHEALDGQIPDTLELEHSGQPEDGDIAGSWLLAESDDRAFLITL